MFYVKLYVHSLVDKLKNVRFCILSKTEGTVSTFTSETRERFKESITERNAHY